MRPPESISPVHAICLDYIIPKKKKNIYIYIYISYMGSEQSLSVKVDGKPQMTEKLVGKRYFVMITAY